MEHSPAFEQYDYEHSREHRDPDLTALLKDSLKDMGQERRRLRAPSGPAQHHAQQLAGRMPRPPANSPPTTVSPLVTFGQGEPGWTRTHNDPLGNRVTEPCDQTIVSDAGRVVEPGADDELVAAGGHYATLWQAWSATRDSTANLK
jgi:hypothetical protein